MTDNMIPVGKGNSICECCGKIHKGMFYEWVSTITKNNTGGGEGCRVARVSKF